MNTGSAPPGWQVAGYRTPSQHPAPDFNVNKPVRTNGIPVFWRTRWAFRQRKSQCSTEQLGRKSVACSLWHPHGRTSANAATWSWRRASGRRLRSNRNKREDQMFGRNVFGIPQSSSPGNKGYTTDAQRNHELMGWSGPLSPRAYPWSWTPPEDLWLQWRRAHAGAGDAQPRHQCEGRWAGRQHQDRFREEIGRSMAGRRPRG